MSVCFQQRQLASNILDLRKIIHVFRTEPDNEDRLVVMLRSERQYSKKEAL